MSRRKQSRPRHVDNDNMLALDASDNNAAISISTNSNSEDIRSKIADDEVGDAAPNFEGGEDEAASSDIYHQQRHIDLLKSSSTSSSPSFEHSLRMNGGMDADGGSKDEDADRTIGLKDPESMADDREATSPSDEPISSCGKCGIGFSDLTQYLSHMKQCGTRHKILMPYDPPAVNGLVSGSDNHTGSRSSTSFPDKVMNQNLEFLHRNDQRNFYNRENSASNDNHTDNDNFDEDEDNIEEDEIMYDEESLRQGLDRNGVDIRGAMHRHFNKFLRDPSSNVEGMNLNASALDEMRLGAMMNPDENFLMSLKNRMAKSLYNSRRGSSGSLSSFKDDKNDDKDKMSDGGKDNTGDVRNNKNCDDNEDANSIGENKDNSVSGRKRKFSGGADGEEEGEEAPEKMDPAVEWAIKAAERGLFGGVGDVTLAPLASTSAAVAQNSNNGALDRESMPEEVNVYRRMLLQLQQQQLMQIQMIQQMRRQLVSSGINPSLLPADLDLSMMSSEGLASVSAAMSGLQNATTAAKVRGGEDEPDRDHERSRDSNDPLHHFLDKVGLPSSNNHHHHNRILESLKLSQFHQNNRHRRDSLTSSNSDPFNNNNNNKDSPSIPTSTSKTSRPSSPDLENNPESSSSSRNPHPHLPSHLHPLYSSDLNLTPGSLESKYLSFPNPESLSTPNSNNRETSSTPSSGNGPTKNPLEILQEKTAASLSSLQLPPGLKPFPPLSSSSNSLLSSSSSSLFSSFLSSSDNSKPHTSSSTISSSALFASSPSLSALHKETEALKPSPILPPLNLPLTPEDYKGYIQRGTILERSQYASDDPFFKHKCRFCHKVFGSDSALQIHVRSHTGERPFKCNICGNRFSTKGNLKVHFERHKAKYPHIKMDATPVPEHLDRHPNLMGAFSQPIPPSVPLPPPPSMPRIQMPPPPPHHHPLHHPPHQQPQQHSPSPSSSSSAGTPNRPGPLSSGPLTPSSSSSPHTPPTPLHSRSGPTPGERGSTGPPPPPLPPHHHHLPPHHPHNSPFPPNFPSPFLPAMSPFGLMTHPPRPDAAGFPFPHPHLPMSLPSSMGPLHMMPGGKDAPFFHPDFHMRPHLPPHPSSQETSVIKATANHSPRERPTSPVNLHKSSNNEATSSSRADNAGESSSKSKPDESAIKEELDDSFKHKDDDDVEDAQNDKDNDKKDETKNADKQHDEEDESQQSPQKDDNDDESIQNTKEDISVDDQQEEKSDTQKDSKDENSTSSNGRSSPLSQSQDKRSRSCSRSPSPPRSTSRPKEFSPNPHQTSTTTSDSTPNSPRMSPRPSPSSAIPSSVISWASLATPPAPVLPSLPSSLLPPPHHPLPPGYPGLGLPYPTGTPTSFPLPSPFHPVLPMSGPRLGGPSPFLPPGPPPPPPSSISSPPVDGSVFRNSILPTKTIDPSENLEQYMEIEKSETSKLEQLVKNIEEKITDPNQCVICHRVLSCKSALQMHYRIHTGERPFKCKICGRSFTTKGNLKTHMGVHRAKPALRMMHQCPVCHKQFTNVLVLQQHIRSHTGSMHHLPPMPMLPSHMDWNHRPMGLSRFHPYGLPHGMHSDSSRSLDLTRRSLFPRTPLSRDRSHSADGGIHKFESPHSIKEERSKDDGSSYGKSGRESPLGQDSEELARPQSASNANVSSDNLDDAEKLSTRSFSPKLDLSKPGDYENAFLPPSFGNAPFDAPLAALEERVKAFDTQIAQTSFEKFRNGMGLGTSIFPNSMTHGDQDLDLAGKNSSPLVKDESLSGSGMEGYDSKHASDYLNENGERSYQCDLCDVFFPDRITLRQHMMTSHNMKDLPDSAFDSEDEEMPEGMSDHEGKMFYPDGSMDNYPEDEESMMNADEDEELNDFTHEYGMHEDNAEMKENMEGNETAEIQLDEEIADACSSQSEKPPTSSSTPPALINDNFNIKKELSDDADGPKTPSSQLPHQQNNNNNIDSSSNEKKTPTNNNVGSSSPTSNRQPGLKHQCMTCMKPFSSASALQIHTRTHTGDKPFKCTVCGKAFTTRGNLKVHMGTHMWNNSPSRRGRRMSIEPPFIMSHMKENPFLPTGFPPRPPHPPADFFYQYPHPMMNGLGAKLNKMSAAMQGMGSVGMPPLPQIPSHLMQEFRLKAEAAKFSERDIMFPQRIPSSSVSDTTEIRSSSLDAKSRSISPASAPPHSGELDLSIKRAPTTSTSSPSSSPPSPQQQQHHAQQSSLSLSMQPSPSASSGSSSTPSPSHNKENSSNIALDLRSMSSAAPWLWGAAGAALPCPQCGQVFSTPDAREHHIRTQHLGHTDNSTPHHLGQPETHPPPKALLA